MIRTATIEDADAIATVAVEAWRWAFSSFVPPEVLTPLLDLPARAARLRERWDYHGFRLVGLDDSGNVIGFAFGNDPPQLDEYDAEIGALYVHPDAARQGLGRELVRHMVAEFRRQDKKNLAIHTLEGNRIGRAFYEKLGGTVRAADDWRGLPAVWYVWEDLEDLSGS